MADAHWTILNLLHRYAECIDAGDFDGVADMFADATLTAEGTELHLEGRDAAFGHYAGGVRCYPDTGSPKTKHVTTNPIIDVDDAAGSATCRSYFTVLQAVPGALALQPIIAGRYHDRFAIVDGEWCFVGRHFITDLMGDLSQHLLFDLDSL